MSSGASVAYEKPRSGRSICIDETPMSSRIASALMSFAASWREDDREVAAEEADVDPGARLEAVEVRLDARVAIDRDELAAARRDPGRAGGHGRRRRTWRRRPSRRAARRGGGAPRPRGRGCDQTRCSARRWATLSALPSIPSRRSAQSGAIPDLEVVVAPDDGDVLAELPVRDERRRQVDAALLVRHVLGGAAEEVALQQAACRAGAGRARRCGRRPSSPTAPAGRRRRCRRAPSRGRRRRRGHRETGPAG